MNPRSSFRGRRWWAAGLILVALATTWLAYRGMVRPAGGEAQWATGTAEVGTILVSVSGSGALVPGRTEELRLASAGRVRRVLAANGQEVQAGQVLAELENELTILAWEQARLTFQAESERLQQMLAGAGARETSVRAAELRVEQARLNLQAREQAYGDLTLRASGPGLVTGLDLRPGDEVAAGTTLMTILETERARVRINVGENRVAGLSVGGRASVWPAPLPQAHTFTTRVSDQAAAGLVPGDRAEVTVDGRFLDGGAAAVFPGTVVEVRVAGAVWEVVCRVPGLPASVPAGAPAASVALHPSGRPGTVVLAAGGAMTVSPDGWALDQAHTGGQGLPARVVSIAGQGSRHPTTGQVTFAVTVALDRAPAGIRSGMTAHAAVWPADGGPLVSELTTVELPLLRVVSASGGRVLRVAVSEGQAVSGGQVLAELDNENVRHQLELARNSLAVETSSLEEQRRPAVADRELRAQEIKVRQAELAMEARAADAASLRIVAPISGRVSGWNPNLTPGRDLPAGALVGRILNYESMTLVVQVDELEVDRLFPGMAASITVDALPGQTFTGVVSEVSPEGVVQQGISRFAVTIAVQAAPRLRSQMTATASIFITEKAGALLVPAESVVFLDHGQGEVSVLGPDGAVEVRRVQIGLTNNKYCEITSGLRAGERVITGVVSRTANPLDWRNPRTGTMPR